MPLFGRKKPKELPPPIEEADELVKQLEKKEKEEKKIEKAKEEEVKRELPKVVEEMGERPAAFAPLFVRLNRYKQILSTMNYLKNTINMVKNGLAILGELDRMREQNLKMIQNSIDKVEKKLLNLDSEFMRPSGFVDQMPEMQDVETVEVTLADLRSQIDQLKVELDQMV